MSQVLSLLAEVADKEPPTVLKLWAVAFLLSAASLVLCRWRRWAVVIAILLSGVWASAIWSELRDPSVGPAVIHQLDRGYVIQGYVTTVLPFAFIIFVLFRSRPNAA